MDRTELPLECWVEKGQIPKELILNKEEYDILWDSHPEKYHKIKIFNKLIDTPRWQQAYGKSYSFSGNISTAKPFTNLLNTFLDWANHNESINGRSPTLNGILVNWYQDGDHYIGWHSDDESQIDGTSPIYTISLGINRTFKIRDKSTKTTKDYEFYNGDYFIMGGKFQKFYQHHVPKRTRCKNSRISITIRKFL
jgi:alkylated DNA repair dioxygenase AlkB